MKADFSGYATKAGVKCSDGRTIMPDAFKQQDKARVPLVWQHGHNDPENVLGHAILENRPDGMYAYGFFNDSPKAVLTKGHVQHKDITMLSIWANQLIERSGNVLHGAIRELSLVLSGANPGALIENVTIHHSDGTEDEVFDDEAIITSGVELEHSDGFIINDDKDKGNGNVTINNNVGDKSGDKKQDEVDQTFDEIIKTMSPEQTKVMMHMVKQALHANGSTTATDEGKTIQDIYDTMTVEQKDVLHYMIGQAIQAAGDNSAKQDNLNNDSGNGNNNDKEGKKMKHNVFEQGDKVDAHVLSHDDMKAVITAATKGGSLKAAVEEYAIAHGITDIDTLFPDAKTVGDVPDWNKRRTEWVADLLGSTRKSLFSRIRTYSADLTLEEARAKGYVTGAMKKEEFFPVARRITTPTTIYKKQALDRDDMIDITDFDVVAWLKGEMRMMLDEELARAVLVGDGRDISNEDKINEQNIRPIATDNELYTTTINVNVTDASSSMNEVLDAVLVNRAKLKGTGTPTFYTTEYWIARFLLIRDNNNVRMYKTLNDLAMELRVDRIVPVEVMLEYPNIIGIMVNPVDYVIGADRGGQVSMFDDFDIDYNKQKYLIETRVSGALTKMKSAMVIISEAGANLLVSPAAPAFVPATGALTVTNQTGVVYKHGVTTINAAGSPYTVPAGETWVVDATPAAGYYFATSDDDQFSYTADEA